MTDDRPIGIFDSGAGGISVLRSLMRYLPGERFAYFGDSLNTPYGSRSEDWVIRRCEDITSFLMDQIDVKTIVIACNTATAVAADILREEYRDFPIFGIEPALKPAVMENPGKTILVMGTEMTLRLDRYKLLVDRWGTESAIVSIPCPGLADAIEDGKEGTEELQELVDSLVGKWNGYADAVVLGCTHYPFALNEIRNALGSDIKVYDGADGTARNVRATLHARGMLAGDGIWRTDEQMSKMILGYGPDNPIASRERRVVPNVWNVPDSRVALMTSGTIKHIVQFEVLLNADREHVSPLW